MVTTGILDWASSSGGRKVGSRTIEQHDLKSIKHNEQRRKGSGGLPVPLATEGDKNNGFNRFKSRRFIGNLFIVWVFEVGRSV